MVTCLPARELAGCHQARSAAPNIRKFVRWSGAIMLGDIGLLGYPYQRDFALARANLTSPAAC